MLTNDKPTDYKNVDIRANCPTGVETNNYEHQVTTHKNRYTERKSKSIYIYIYTFKYAYI